MQVNLETLEGLQRRLKIAVPATEINSQINARLKQVARTAKIQGFRPGKAPMHIVSQQHGLQVREDVLNEMVNRSFSDAVNAQKLRVAGYPQFEVDENAATEESFEFAAIFEVYPQVVLADLSATSIEIPETIVSDAEVQKTLDVLRKQRVTYAAADRASAAGDRVVVDFVGKIDGVEFAGGASSDFPFVLGEGQMLPEFDAAATGLSVGESKVFTVNFPADYHGKDVAGKAAEFTVTVKEVNGAVLPEIDSEFAKKLGVANGDVAQLLSEVRANVEREVSRRIKAKTKQSVMQALFVANGLELPSALVQMEISRLIEQTRRDFEGRGMDVTKMPFPGDLFKAEAERRVALGLIVGEIVSQHALEAKPEQVRAIIDDFASSYEDPSDVLKWYYAKPERLDGPTSLAIEDNVVAWALAQAKVEVKTLPFDDLMAAQANGN